MPGDRPDRVSELYHAALGHAPEDRGEFLRQACEGDEPLRAEVESLLCYEGESAQFLERPPDPVVSKIASHMVGRHLGPYTILAPIGAGGMGEVYRARDSKLGREVALKILPTHFMADPDRRARFAREARLLATLNHPHIGAIYGLEESDGLTALVLELVEGPTLEQRVERGPLSLADALTIARQIADALEAAHSKGIVHRDLKPANIVLLGTSHPNSGDVRVKVLDFGLAKPFAADGAGDLTQPTSSLDGTAVGRILGTPAYMSPEQTRGQPVDKRTDIWAFGCVLYELATGRRAFEGDTISDTFVHILEREPDWTALPHDTPISIRTLLQRCLRKDPQKRLHDIADARIEIDEEQSPLLVSAPTRTGIAPALNPHRRRERFAWLVAAFLGVALFAVSVLLVRDRAAQPGVHATVEFSVNPPENWPDQGLGPTPRYALSPDGQQLVAVSYSQGTSMLWVRPIAGPGWRQLAGSEEANAPFWSPDGRSIGFVANDTLKTIRLNGGLAIPLCPARSNDSVGGTWNRKGVIIFGGGDVLHQVSSSGGTPTPVTALAQGDTAHQWPWFLPDDDHFLYLARLGAGSELRIGSLTSTETRSLGPIESNAIYADGHLLFVRGDTLTAQAFEPTSLQLRGEPIVLASQASIYLPARRGIFSASANGVLAYSISRNSIADFTWFDRGGQPLSTVDAPGFIINLDLNRDDSKVAVSLQTRPPGGQAEVDIWIVELTRAGTSTKLTFEPHREFDPAWSADGSYVAFTMVKSDGSFGLYRRRANFSGESELLDGSALVFKSPAWSPDDRFLVYTKGTQHNGDLWTVPLRGERKPSVFLKTPYDESNPSFSPDGRWIAFQSNKSGHTEVYVRAFTEDGGEIKISQHGGRAPRWRADGRELFFWRLTAG